MERGGDVVGVVGDGCWSCTFEDFVFEVLILVLGQFDVEVWFFSGRKTVT
jgi:hypothetical protein